MPKTKDDATGKLMSLLLVDDDLDDVELVRRAVFSFDQSIQVSVAHNGQEALLYLFDLAQTLPDIILMDLRMPRMDGRKCLLALRANERLANIPVVIYTTSQDVQESMDLQALGAVHFISKPSDPEDVYYILSLLMEERFRELSSHGKAV